MTYQASNYAMMIQSALNDTIGTLDDRRNNARLVVVGLGLAGDELVNLRSECLTHGYTSRASAEVIFASNN